MNRTITGIGGLLLIISLGDYYNILEAYYYLPVGLLLILYGALFDKDNNVKEEKSEVLNDN